MTADPRPTCPQCGCPARIVIVRKAHVRCELNEDGSLGRVRSAARGPDSTVAYECGGGHTFDGGAR